MKTLFRSIIVLILPALLSCSGDSDESKGAGPYRYVKPSVDYRGRYRKGHMRKSVSTDKNAYKNRARSRYYYQTRGKYRRKSRSSSK